MKKICILALALCLLVSATLPAMAEDVTYPFGLTGNETFPEAVDYLTGYFSEIESIDETDNYVFFVRPDMEIHGYSISAITVKRPEDNETLDSLAIQLKNAYKQEDLLNIMDIYAEMLDSHGSPIWSDPIKKTYDLSGMEHVYSLKEELDQICSAFVDKSSSFIYSAGWENVAMRIEKDEGKSSTITIVYKFGNGFVE